MKKNILINILFALLVLISGCSDVLDRPELNDMNDDTYWRNETDLRLFSNGFNINYFVGYNNAWGVAIISVMISPMPTCNPILSRVFPQAEEARRKHLIC